MTKFIDLIVFGKVKESYIMNGIAEFEKRLSRFSKLNKIILPDKGISINSAKTLEYNSINTYILDPDGKELTSEEFSKLISKTEEKLIFIIAGAEGFTDDVKNKIKRISLSKMTFTHEMAQLLFVEQLYRSFAIINHVPYHK